MAARRTHTVEIAGGGIAGLTAGLAFARQGWRVRVHEQDADLRILGAGIYIWENGLRVLETLGVYDAVIDGALPAWRHQKRDADDRVFSSDDFSRADRLYVPLRKTLLTALRDALLAAGGEVVFGSQAVGADPDGALRFADGSRATADLVIGADGVNSRVRDALGLLRWRRPANQHGYRIMIERRPAELDTDVGRTHVEYWNGSRRLLYAPCTADLAYVQLTSVAGDTTGNTIPIDHAFWRGLFPHLAWIIERIPQDGRGDWFELIKLKDWSAGRVAILGDAANTQPPFLGQGGGCSMMAALSLAASIQECDDIDAGIALWKRREKRVTEWIQQVAFWYGQLAFLPPRLRVAAFRALSVSDWVKTRTILVASTRIPTGTRGAPGGAPGIAGAPALQSEEAR
jgi:2-polyprenyl-6-methoxyphenol hydroxylase-like FAD-dependent oxidoreductase